MEVANKVAIVLHGDFAQPNDLRLWTSEAEVVIAADGAADVLLELGITPTKVIGDLDAIRADTLQSLPAEDVIHEESQDTTDFQKALAYSQKKYARAKIVVLGFEGTRLDHVLSTLSSSPEGLRLVGSDAQLFVLGKGTHVLHASQEVRVSLLPYPAARVSFAEGLLYDPVGLDLRLGGKDGVSNEATADKVKLTIESGRLLVFVQRFEGEQHW
jgi:thiamine pyrophosphokinase